MITGQEQPDSGDHHPGRNREAGLCRSDPRQLDDKKTVWEEVSGGQDILKVGDYEMPSRAYIGRFNFKGADQQKRVGELSGGERGRLQLAKLLQPAATCMLLDEPSNDLDVETLRALEERLLDLPRRGHGASPTTAGSSTVSPPTSWPFEGDEVDWFDGNYTEFECTFVCEREWISNVLNRFLGGKRFDLDSGRSANGDQFTVLIYQ
jgi:sulfate-transporting ATPase